jgi:hypothetical protein
MKKLYIAASLKDADQVLLWRDEFKKVELPLTFDWATRHKRGAPVNADEMINAVKQADVVIFLAPGGRGFHVELGVALTLEKKIVMVGVDMSNATMFYNHSKIWHVKFMQDAYYKTIRLLLEKL